MSVEEPQQELEVRHQALSPASPKPIYHPTPSNIPILEKQMDPAFDTALVQGLIHDSVDALAPEGNLTSIADDVRDPDQAVAAAVESVERTAQEEGGNPIIDTDTIITQTQSDQDAAIAQDPNFQSMPPLEPAMAGLDNAAAPVDADVSMIDAPLSHDAIGEHYAENADSQVSSSDTIAQSLGPPIEVRPSPGPDIVDFQSLLDNLAKTAPEEIAVEVQTTAMNEDVEAPAASDLNTQQPPVADSTLLPPEPVQPAPATHSTSVPQSAIAAPSQLHAMPAQLPPAAQFAPGTQPVQQNVLAPPPGTVPAMPPAPYAGLPSNPMLKSAAQLQPGVPAPWTPEMEKAFAQYQETERGFEQEKNWRKFPDGSRMFVGKVFADPPPSASFPNRSGNMSTELATKRDIFALFSKYGPIVQISIKKAFGFVQFLDAETCRVAVEKENGSMIQGRSINLEVSKAQDSKDNTRNNDRTRRRSRSPERNRNSTGGAPRNVDRYVSNASPPRDYRNSDRHYRGGRSPSPRGYGRDRYGASPDRYGRRRDRSPDRYNRRSPSPRRSVYGDHRPSGSYSAPGQGQPDVQILVLENIDRAYITNVEAQLSFAHLRSDTRFLDPYQRPDMQRIMEDYASKGVTALIQLTSRSPAYNVFTVVIFNRSPTGKVDFEVYDNIQSQVATTLITTKRAAMSQAMASYPPAGGSQHTWRPPVQGPPAPAAPAYGYPPPSQAPQYPYGAAQQPSNVANLLSSLGAPQQSTPAYSPAGQIPQHSRQTSTGSFSSAAGRPAAPQQYGAYPQASYNPSQMPAGAPYHQRQPSGQPPTPTQPNAADLLSSLAAYKRN